MKALKTLRIIVISVLVLVMAFGPDLPAHAADPDWKDISGYNDVVGVTDPENAQSADGSFAIFFNGNRVDYKFDLGIPEGSTASQIQVKLIARKHDQSYTSSFSATVLGSSQTATLTTSSRGYILTWNGSWTAEQLADFEVRVSAIAGMSGQKYAALDHIQVTVTYGTPVTINYVSSDNDMGTVDPSSETINPGGTAQGSTAEANPGYKFVNWTCGSDIVGTDLEYIPQKTDGVYVAATYTAIFEKDESQWRTVTFEAGENGSLTGAPLTQSVVTGTAWTEIEEPTPVPASGYEFDDWSPEFPETVTENATYTANFVELERYSINAVVNNPSGGSIEFDPPGNSYLPGTVVTLTARSNPGFTFVHWLKGTTSYVVAASVDIPDGYEFYSTEPSITVEVTDDEELMDYLAVFEGSPVKRETRTYTVFYHPNGGMGSVPVDMNLYYRGDKVILASGAGLTKPGSVFLGWALADGTPVTDQYTMGSKDVTFFAVWGSPKNLPDVPKTGDEASIIGFTLLFAGLAVAAVILIRKRALVK